MSVRQRVTRTGNSTVGLEFHALPTLDPALAGHGIVQQVGGVDKIDLAVGLHRPLV
jgi:hypothetical protein